MIVIVIMHLFHLEPSDGMYHRALMERSCSNACPALEADRVFPVPRVGSERVAPVIEHFARCTVRSEKCPTVTFPVLSCAMTDRGGGVRALERQLFILEPRPDLERDPRERFAIEHCPIGYFVPERGGQAVAVVGQVRVGSHGAESVEDAGEG